MYIKKRMLGTLKINSVAFLKIENVCISIRVPIRWPLF